MENKSKCCGAEVLKDIIDGQVYSKGSLICTLQKNSGLTLSEVYAQQDDVIEFSSYKNGTYYNSHPRSALDSAWPSIFWLECTFTITKRKSDQVEKSRRFKGLIKMTDKDGFEWADMGSFEKLQSEIAKLKEKLERAETLCEVNVGTIRGIKQCYDELSAKLRKIKELL